MNAIKFAWFWLICGLLTCMVGTIFIEHSQLDVYISQLFYHYNNIVNNNTHNVANNITNAYSHHAQGYWLLEKDSQPWAFLFYDGIKVILIIISILLLLAWLVNLYQHFQKQSFQPHANTLSQKIYHILPTPITQLCLSQQSYLLSCFLLIPLTVATIKRYTHVACPIHLQLFGGDMPYLTLWQSIASDFETKCFPAAHASSGFALMAVAFICRCSQWRYRWLIIGAILGWLMGGYKMLIGDHFFSHTITSMGIAWLISGILALIWQHQHWLPK